MSTQCKFIKPNGKPCQAYAVLDSDYCFWHSPAMLEQRIQARKKGGLHRHVMSKRVIPTNYNIKTIDDVLQILKDAVNDACLLENSQARARTIGYLCQIVIKGLEVSELESRISNLERRLI